MIKAVIFDMDSLLVNSEPLWDEVDQSLLRKRGHIFSASIRLKRIGIGQHATVELFKKEFDLTDKVSELLSERQKHFKKLFTKNPVLMEGTLEIIELFYSIGIKMGIATGGCDENSVKHLFKHFAIEKKFHSITTSHEVANGKPAPDIFLLEAKKLNVDPSSCLVLEDTPVGIQAAKTAGMKAIAVNNTGSFKSKDFQKADLFVRSLKEINGETIEKLFSA